MYTPPINVDLDVKRDVRQTPKQRCRRNRLGLHTSPVTLKSARGKAARVNGGATRGHADPSVCEVAVCGVPFVGQGVFVRACFVGVLCV